MTIPPPPGSDLLRLLSGNRTRLFDPLPPEYDPMRADDALLDRVGFPPRPDAATQGELRDLWFMMFSPPLERIEVTFDDYPPDDYPSGKNTLRAGGVHASSRHQSSLNWSGASLVARDGQMFTDVIGAWHVPTVSVPDHRPAGVNDFRSSTWIGLDGQRGYLNATLPQIGTAQRVERTGTGDTVTTYSWLEWWPSHGEVTITGMPVHPGDRMAAWVRVIPPDPAAMPADPAAMPAEPMSVRMLIINLGVAGPKPYAVFEVPVPEIPWPGSDVDLQPAVAGATVEWIMERPTNPSTRLPRELPHFDEVVFNPCFALTAPTPSEPRELARFAGVNLIQMFRRETSPSRGTRMLARAKRTGRNAFKIGPRSP